MRASVNTDIHGVPRQRGYTGMTFLPTENDGTVKYEGACVVRTRLDERMLSI
jgi:hypothetical protein